jgi:hypothetical protein
VDTGVTAALEAVRQRDWLEVLNTVERIGTNNISTLIALAQAQLSNYSASINAARLGWEAAKLSREKLDRELVPKYAIISVNKLNPFPSIRNKAKAEEAKYKAQQAAAKTLEDTNWNTWKSGEAQRSAFEAETNQRIGALQSRRDQILSESSTLRKQLEAKFNAEGKTAAINYAASVLA